MSFFFRTNLWRAIDSLPFCFSKLSLFLVELNKQRNVLKQISEPYINDGYFTCEIFWYLECDLSYSLYMQVFSSNKAGVLVFWTFPRNIKNFTGIVCRIKRNYCMKFQRGVLNFSLRELAFGRQMKWALGTCTQITSVLCRYMNFFILHLGSAFCFISKYSFAGMYVVLGNHTFFGTLGVCDGLIRWRRSDFVSTPCPVCSQWDFSIIDPPICFPFSPQSSWFFYFEVAGVCVYL